MEHISLCGNLEVALTEIEFPFNLKIVTIGTTEYGIFESKLIVFVSKVSWMQ